MALVEGPADRWRVGKRNSLAVLGKTVRLELLERIEKRIHPKALILVLFDPEQSEGNKGRPHHIDEAFQQCTDHFGPGRVGKVWLPEGTDPGSLERDLLWEIIHSQRREQGLRLPKLKTVNEIRAKYSVFNH